MVGGEPRQPGQRTMSDTVFKPGDVVTLRSGGPHMTVETAAGLIGCVWFPSFDSSQPQTRMFAADVLKPVSGADLDDSPAGEGGA
jgi:uncharacterized protein YodC (DUF2158 family)